MLVTSIFFFSHSVFYSITKRKYHFSNVSYVVCKCFQFGHVQKFVFEKGLSQLQKLQKIIISPNLVRYFLYNTAAQCTHSIYLSTSDLLSFIISNTDKYEFSSIWKWISCCNDVMNNVDCVIKRDVYPPKIHSCSKNIRWISVFVLKISVVYRMVIPLVKR